MKRLIVTGFPCSSEPWRKVFASGDNTFLPLAEVIRLEGCADIRKMTSTVNSTIEALSPDQIVAHDIGLTTALLALIRRRKKDQTLPSSLVLFNGAFSGFDVFKAPHPIWIQLKPEFIIRRELSNLGVILDPHLCSFIPEIRKMYRQIIAVSIMDKLRLTRHRTRAISNWPIKTLLIEGINDPFIPKSSIDKLELLLPGVRRVVGYEGHFPYLGDFSLISKQIEEFES